ncbi:hypothetical protein ABID65_008562 [Bradyrhizobium sp. S3.9.2]
MSPYSRRQAIALVAGFATSAAPDARAKDSNMPRNAVMDIDIKRNGSRPSTKGNADWFTGSVRVDPLFQAPDPGRVSGGQVTFEPGARTAWHTHPLCRPRMGAARGRIDRGDPRRRRRLVSAGSEALARRFAHDGHDAYRHPGILQRKERRLDGEGGRRPVPKVRCPRCTAETTMNFVRLPTPTTCTSPRSGRTGGHTGHRRGYGPSRLTARSTFAATMDRTPGGTGPLRSRRPGGSSPPASPRKWRSNRSTDRFWIRSTRPIARSIAAIDISNR